MLITQESTRGSLIKRNLDQKIAQQLYSPTKSQIPKVVTYNGEVKG